MSTESEFMSLITKKAMAYDLTKIFEKEPDKTYTTQELKVLIDAYISGVQQ